ncbi:hypothetical protein PDR5_31230 [Pseudomonas sp. DR 5-09]|nr:hypothetical protein PDR5_31230 [Pseudomonas sp. DR 5-09]
MKLCRRCVKLCKGFAQGRVRAYILYALIFIATDKASRAGSLPQGIAFQMWERACSR